MRISSQTRPGPKRGEARRDAEIRPLSGRLGRVQLRRSEFLASKEEGGTLNEALEAIARFNLAQSAKDFSEPVDKTKWENTPQTVNCVFGQQANGIYILGPYARGDSYNSEMSDEELLGTLGIMIGHEISHAFDSTGAQFDKNGDMRSRWTEEDYAKFLERNKKMVDYYNAIHPWEGRIYMAAL